MFTLPDKGEGQNDIQSILCQEYLDVIVAGIAGIDYVVSGGVVTAQGTPNQTVAVAAANVISNSQPFTVGASASVAVSAADATFARLDLVVINNAGAIAVRAGTAAAAPKPPARSANDVVLAVLFIPAADTTIDATAITDLRMVAPVRSTVKKCIYTNETLTIATNTMEVGVGDMTFIGTGGLVINGTGRSGLM